MTDLDKLEELAKAATEPPSDPPPFSWPTNALAALAERMDPAPPQHGKGLPEPSRGTASHGGTGELLYMTTQPAPESAEPGCTSYNPETGFCGNPYCVVCSGAAEPARCQWHSSGACSRCGRAMGRGENGVRECTDPAPVATDTQARECPNKICHQYLLVGSRCHCGYPATPAPAGDAEVSHEQARDCMRILWEGGIGSHFETMLHYIDQCEARQQQAETHRILNQLEWESGGLELAEYLSAHPDALAGKGVRGEAVRLLKLADARQQQDTASLEEAWLRVTDLETQMRSDREQAEREVAKLKAELEIAWSDECDPLAKEVEELRAALQGKDEVIAELQAKLVYLAGDGASLGFGVDPEDSAALLRLRECIDDNLPWPDDATRETGNYEAAVRHSGELSRKLEAAERELKDFESPTCSGEWLSGSGGHRKFGGCGKPAVWVEHGTGAAFCDEHGPTFRGAELSQKLEAIAEDRRVQRVRAADAEIALTEERSLTADLRLKLEEAERFSLGRRDLLQQVDAILADAGFGSKPITESLRELAKRTAEAAEGAERIAELHRKLEAAEREVAMARRELTFRDSAVDALRRAVVNGCALTDSLREQLAHVTELDAYARRLGTQLDIPSELPGLDEDHVHFVMMPIGTAARRAAVAWMKQQHGELQPAPPSQPPPAKPLTESDVRTIAREVIAEVAERAQCRLAHDEPALLELVEAAKEESGG